MGDGGRLAVIAPGARIADLARAIPAAVPGDRTEVLDSPVALLTVGQSKGLEFDRVVLVDPAGILAQSPAGGHDLYVAITRATHRLTVVYDGELPASLHRLASIRHAMKCLPVAVPCIGDAAVHRCIRHVPNTPGTTERLTWAVILRLVRHIQGRKRLRRGTYGPPGLLIK